MAAVTRAFDGAGPLAPGETLLWQGRPEPAQPFEPGHLRILGMVGFLAVFAGLVVFVATDVPILLRLAGLGVLALVLRGVLKDTVLAGWRLRHTRYGLTNRRAIIATHLPLWPAQVQSFPITAETLLGSDGGDPFATLTFGPPTAAAPRRSADPAAFVRIPDGPAVLALMRRIQGGAA